MRKRGERHGRRPGGESRRGRGPDPIWSGHVVAFVFRVPDATATLTQDVIQPVARDTMAKHMPPKHVGIVADIPRSPTNEVEKYELRQPIEAEPKGTK